MSEADFLKERLFHPLRKTSGISNGEQRARKQSSNADFDDKFHGETAVQESHAVGNWCEVVSSTLSNVNARQAWKNGTEKLSQTFSNVKTTFGVLSQRIKKSTKRRQPLVNTESPITPYSRSKVALGRTPTKLYSPFSIDTPRGKENISNRLMEDEAHSSIKERKKKPRRTRLDLGVGETKGDVGEAILSSDLLQTQIGIYEFQSVANRILQNCSSN